MVHPVLGHRGLTLQDLSRLESQSCRTWQGEGVATSRFLQKHSKRLGVGAESTTPVVQFALRHLWALFRTLKLQQKHFFPVQSSKKSGAAAISTSR